MNAPSPLRRKTSGERVGRPPFPELEKFGPRLARLFEHRIKSFVGAEAGCRFESLEVMKFSALPPTPEDAVIAIAALPTGGFGGYFTLDAALAAQIIDASLGSPSDSAPSPTRRLTPVDEAMALPFVEELFGAFNSSAEAAWGAAHADGLVFSRYAGSTAALIEMEAEAEMLAIDLSVGFGPDAAGARIALRFSLAALDRMRGAQPTIEEVEPEPAPRDPLWSAAMRRAAAQADLKLLAVLRRMRMNLGEASEMRPGDIIPLSRDGGMRVEIALAGAEGGVLCAGLLGAADDRRAARIEEPPDPNLTEGVRALITA